MKDNFRSDITKELKNLKFSDETIKELFEKSCSQYDLERRIALEYLEHSFVDAGMTVVSAGACVLGVLFVYYSTKIIPPDRMYKEFFKYFRYFLIGIVGVLGVTLTSVDGYKTVRSLVKSVQHYHRSNKYSPYEPLAASQVKMEDILRSSPQHSSYAPLTLQHQPS